MFARTTDPVAAILCAWRRQLAGAAALLTGHQLGEAAVPVVLGLAINDAIARPGFGRLVLWLILLGGDFAALSLCWRFGSRVGAKVRFGIAHDLRSAVVARALDERGFAGGHRPDGGALLTIAVSDGRRVGDATRISLAASAAVTVLVASLAAVAAVSPLLALIVIAGAALTLVAVAVLSLPVEARSRAEQEASADVSALAVDMIAGLRVLAGLRAGAAAGTRYRSASAAAVHSSIRAAETEAAISGIAAFAIGCYLTAVAAVSAELGLHGDISIGAVIAVLGLSQLLLGPLQTVAQTIPSIRRGHASAARISELLATPTMLSGTGTLAFPAAADLTIDGLILPGLAHLSMTVPGGSLHGVVCDSPLAAESLMLTLAGELAPVEGRVLLGDIDLIGVSPHARRGALLAWQHQSMPLGATVAELVGADAHGSEVAAQAIAAAGAEEILDRIPGGWDAQVSEHGASLSGGERQRLALARVLAEQPPVLVLHEPTSAVDAVTEITVANGIRARREGLTTVLVTTSTTLLARCDQVSLISNGRLVVTASHQKLLELDSYRELVGR